MRKSAMHSKARVSLTLALPAILYLVAILAFLKDHHARFDFPLDDAWIHQVYARAFASGQGFAYNAGEQEAGATSPLWAIVTAPAHWLEGLGTHAVVFAVKGIGVLLGLVCVLATQRIASRLTGSLASGVIAASLLALEPKLLFSALSGMESVLFAAVLLVACLMLMERRPVGFLVLIGLAPVVRPEALILLPCALPGLLLCWRAGSRGLPMPVACLVPILPMALWVSFCMFATGHLLPNTFYLKAHAFSLGIREVIVGWTAITQYGLVPFWMFPLGLGVFCLRCLRAGRTGGAPVLMLMIVPLVYALGVVGSRNVTLDGYYWTRWLDPAALLLTVACAGGFAFALTAALSRQTRSAGEGAPEARSWIRILVSLGALVCLLLAVPTFASAYINRRDQLASDSRAINILNVGMGTWIREHTPQDSVIAVNDAGAIRYFGQRHTIDLMGLNCADIAFGKTTLNEAIARADWLAIFPLWFKPSGFLDQILIHFEPRETIRIPLAEYTICNAPSQTLKVAFQRKAPPAPPDT